MTNMRKVKAPEGGDKIGIRQSFERLGKAMLSHTHAAADIVSGLLARARGGTGTDMTLTGGTGHVLKQNSLDGAVTSGTVVAANIASDAVETAKILNANVTAAKLVNSGVHTGDATGTFPTVTIATLVGDSGSGGTKGLAPAPAAGDAAASKYLDAAGGWSIPAGTYTTEMAQDAVGAALTDTATIDLTYDDAGNAITADLIAAGALTAIKTVDGTGSGLDADLLDGSDSTAFAAASHVHTASDITSGIIADARMPNLTGDVTTVEGAVATTIADGAVTYAKMQDVSATDKLLGRSTSGSGDVEEIACTAAGRALLDDAAATNQLTTLGLSANGKSLVTAADYAAMRVLLGGAYRIVSGTDSVVAADRNGLVDCSGTFTLSLPAAATATAGFTVWIRCASGVLTIDGDGTEVIGGALTNVLTAAGSIVCLQSYGSGWSVLYANDYLTSSANTTLVTGTSKTITSLSIPAGEWDISCASECLSGTAITSFATSLSTTDNTLTVAGFGETRLDHVTVATSGFCATALPTNRVILTAATTYYVVANSTFTTTPTCYGYIMARRVG